MLIDHFLVLSMRQGLSLVGSSHYPLCLTQWPAESRYSEVSVNISTHKTSVLFKTHTTGAFTEQCVDIYISDIWLQENDDCLTQLQLA